MRIERGKAQLLVLAPYVQGRLAGWRAFKSTNRSLPGMRAIEAAVLRGLRPSAAIERRLHHTRLSLGLASRDASSAEHASRPSFSYGCLHARIERDMQASWQANRAGLPPTLLELFRQVSGTATVNNTTTIFVAVGVDISDGDETLLRQSGGANRAPWGARLVRTHDGKAHQRGSFATKHGVSLSCASPSQLDCLHYNRSQGGSYTHASLVDFELCRRATWLAAWPGSSFSSTLGRLRELERDEDWFAACRGAPALIRARGWFKCPHPPTR